MISRLFRRKAETPATPNGSVPAGQRIYAIGDIHGRIDLLDMLLEKIERDIAARGAADTQILFLGDLIDRGPDSASVVARAIEIEAGPRDARFLLGNHEEVFLKVLDGDRKALPFFCKIGGKETILSYDISLEEYDAADYPELQAMLIERVPAEHVAFLQRCENLIIAGDYAFVHAGVRPGEPLTAQKPTDLRWIREEFLSHRGGFEKIIVHGHTITAEVEESSHRIGLDTGAYASGKLSAMAFEGEARWLLQTGA